MRRARSLRYDNSNICTVHDVGPDYLVMELVAGETLADCLRSGRLPIKKALSGVRRSRKRWKPRTTRGSSIAI